MDNKKRLLKKIESKESELDEELKNKKINSKDLENDDIFKKIVANQSSLGNIKGIFKI